MKAIQTRYLGHTATLPIRIKAWAEGVGSLTITRDDLPDHLDPHRAAAVALCRRHDWAPILASGTLPNGDQAHVFGFDIDADPADSGDVSEAARACIADLRHYVATHGPGPDVRLEALLRALGDA